MGIFTHNKRTVADATGFGGQSLRCQIGIVVDVRVSAVSITERQCDGVECYSGIAHRLEVRSYSTLITHTPQDDAGIVLVALHQ